MSMLFSPLNFCQFISRLKMQRWQNKIAIVTGASGGIGAACAKAMVGAGLVVVGLARRAEMLREVKASLPKELRSKFHPLKCDVSKEDQIKEAFKWTEHNLGVAQVLLNNAGITKSTELIKPDNTEDIRAVIDTNIMGVLWCSREAFNSMKAHNLDGHILIINSIAGHQVLNFIDVLPSFNIYPATKFAITAMTEIYRQEFQLHKGICPGATNTNIFPEDIQFFVKDMARLQPQDIADAVLFAIGTPPNVQIHEVTVKPMGEMF